MADIGTIEIKGLEERIKQFSEASTKNPMMQKRINEVIRQALAVVRKNLSNDARSGLGMKSDPRSAYRAVRSAVYRKIFGGQVNILQNRRAGNMRYYEPQRTLQPGQRGGNRRQQSQRTREMMSYQGKDRGMVLRWLSDGTTARDTRYGSRGSIAARNWFGPASQREMANMAEKLDAMINDIVQGIMY
jgi:hypothetical protein